jgi:hypothetical protein
MAMQNALDSSMWITRPRSEFQNQAPTTIEAELQANNQNPSIETTYSSIESEHNFNGFLQTLFRFQILLRTVSP